MSTPIQNAEDLAKQTAIKYGCQYGESTYRFFQVCFVATFNDEILIYFSIFLYKYF